jgi:hypothetical protein
MYNKNELININKEHFNLKFYHLSEKTDQLQSRNSHLSFIW